MKWPFFIVLGKFKRRGFFVLTFGQMLWLGKKELPGCSVKHKLDIPFSAHVSINGVKGKRECGPFMFFLPCGLATACCDATVTGKNAKALNDKLAAEGGAPAAVEMAA